jgi:phage terminase large subunit-like protein
LVDQIPGYDPVETRGDSVFDEEAARNAIDFFPECLRHVKGERADEPFRLEPWQQAIIANLFGWKRPDGTRRYREALLFVPRKNGKSCLGAGIGLLLLFCDGEPGAEVYSAAADRDQANIVFSMAKAMVLAEPTLSQASEVLQKSIRLRGLLSFYKVVSSEVNTKHGYNAHGVIVDELHAQPNPELVDVLKTSQGARRQPLMVYITTSDFEREGSVCNEKHSYACKVRDGIIDDPSFLPVIYEADKEEDWTTPEVWRKANPNLGISLSEEFLTEECQKAQELPRYENTFKRLFLNIRTGQEVRWLSIESWDASAGGIPAKDLEDHLLGETCYGGLDLSSVSDLTAFALVFPREAGNYAAVLRFWVPAENARERERRDKVPYHTWAREGWLEETPGGSVDYATIRKRINELGEQYAIQEVAIDPYNAEHTSQDLKSDGFEPVFFRQGFLSMSGPSKQLETLIIAGKLQHGGNPVLRWNISNVTCAEDSAGNIKPNKAKSGEKIDGVVATIMALGRAMMRQEKFRSVYEQRGLLRL